MLLIKKKTSDAIKYWERGITMSIQEVIAALVNEKREEIARELEIINEGIEYLQMEQESLMASDIISDEIVEKTFDCINNRRTLELIKAKFEYISLNISDTDEVSDIYTH